MTVYEVMLKHDDVTNIAERAEKILSNTSDEELKKFIIDLEDVLLDYRGMLLDLPIKENK